MLQPQANTDRTYSDAYFSPALLHRLRSSSDLWIDTLLGVFCILPLLLTAHLPLTDLPNHLARQYILSEWATSPALQTFYWIRWDLVPNLALELFVLAARQIMSIDMAVRAFCISTVLMLFLGTRLINRTLSQGQSRIYRVVPLLCYGGPILYGFLSYCFGVGLALLLFGIYLHLSEKLAVRCAFLLVSGCALMLCHLAAFGVFALAVGGYELTTAFSAAGLALRRLPGEVLKRQIVPVGCLLCVIAIFIGFGPDAAQSSDVNATRFSFQFGSLHEKVQAIYAITSFASPWLETGLLALALAGLAVALLTRNVRFHPAGLTISVIMLLVWMMTPAIALGAAFIQYRLPWAISFFVLAGLVPGKPALVRPLRLYFIALAGMRIGLISLLWWRWEPMLTALDQALMHYLPTGSRLVVVEGRLPEGRLFRSPDLGNVAAYAVARRQGFETGIFANLSGQILHFQPHFAALWMQDGFARVIPDALDHLEPDYDHVLVLLPQFAHISPTLPLSCEEKGPNFALLKVEKGDVRPDASDAAAHCLR